MAASCEAPRSDQSWRAHLDAFIQSEIDAKGIPAVSIAVVDDQSLVWTKGYGLSDPETMSPVTAETNYRVASVSKLFTSLMVMQLVEQGVLDLDEPIITYAPKFQPENPFEIPITLRQLLTHRSGLVREPPVGHYFDPTEPTLEDMVRSLNQTSLIYAPKSRIKYSNAAVSLAGYVVERVRQIPFEAHAQEALIDPLGMEHTSFLARDDLRENLGIGYMWRYDTNALAEAPVFQLGIGPAANLYTTVSDLGKFVSALFAIARGDRADILSPESLEQMWTVQFAEPDAKNGYGLGFYVSEFESLRRVQHAGVMYGYATRVYALPEAQVGVALVANLDATNPVVDRIGDYALSLLLAAKDGRELPVRAKTESVEPGVARALEGRYEGPEELALKERNDRLVLARGAEQFDVRTLNGEFITDGRLGYGFTFTSEGDTLYSAAGRYVRQTDRRPTPMPQEWEGLVGEYGWDHNTLYVYENKGRLHALIEWFFQYLLREVSADKFLGSTPFLVGKLTCGRFRGIDLGLRGESKWH